jgi:hypothetical protein
MGRVQLCKLKGIPVVELLVPLDIEAVAVVTAILIREAIMVVEELSTLAVVSVDASYSAAYPASSAHSAKGDAVVVMGK